MENSKMEWTRGRNHSISQSQSQTTCFESHSHISCKRCEFHPLEFKKFEISWWSVFGSEMWKSIKVLGNHGRNQKIKSLALWHRIASLTWKTEIRIWCVEIWGHASYVCHSEFRPPGDFWILFERFKNQKFFIKR